MQFIYYIAEFLVILAGIFCTAMVCIATFQIMTGDEQEYKKYQTRIKNGIIALILIISIGTIKNMVLNYFPYTQSYDSIGDFSNIRAVITDGVLIEEHKDIDARKVIRVEGNYYVNTGEKLINIGGFWDQYKIWCSVYKQYDDCQGVTKGAMADDIYYLSWENDKLDGKSKGFLMPANIKGTIKDDNDFKDLLGTWLNNKYQQFEWLD